MERWKNMSENIIQRNNVFIIIVNIIIFNIIITIIISYY